MTPGAPITTPWSATVADTDGPLTTRLLLQLDDDPTPDQLAFWEQIVGSFFHCAATGCFCDDRSAHAASVSADPPTFNATGRSLDFSAPVVGVSSSAWQVLIAMVLAASEYFMPVAQLQFAAQSASPHPRRTAPELLALDYPARRKPRFPIDERLGGPGDPSKDRRVEIVFKQALNEESFERVAAFLEAWSEIANGGYPAADLHPVENACDPAGVQALGPHRVEYFIPNLLGDEAALGALLNGLGHLHEQGLEISAVRLE